MLAAAAREETPAARPARQSRRRLWRPIAAVGLAALLLPAGLAAAGVDLPTAVDKPYEIVGIALPHQERTARPRHATPAHSAHPGPGPVATPPTPTVVIPS